MRHLTICLGMCITLFTASTHAGDSLFARSNLVAWCIVPYDENQRTPEQRAEMLERIGIKRFAYDWRAAHLPTFETELTELSKRRIELTAVWFPATLDQDARVLLDALRKHKLKTQLWITTGVESVQAGVEVIAPIAREAARADCTVALYNHGGWFGEPEHQIAIIEKLKAEGITNVGIVYNLHHGHAQIDRFADLLDKMKPFLFSLNLNGMTRDGDKNGKKILPVGKGELDLALLQTIKASGYTGPIGILNHTELDAETRLLENLDGLRKLVSRLE